MAFVKKDIEGLRLNPFTLINKEWMLITAGDERKHNTMTASWGGVGELWGHYVSTIYVRPHRYTYEFVEEKGYYSLCFFDEKYRAALNLCGTKSGRDMDKAKEAGLTPVFAEQAPYYEEANMVFICRKLYRQDLEEGAFIDESLVMKCYPEKDFHRMYVGAIEKVLVKE